MGWAISGGIRTAGARAVSEDGPSPAGCRGRKQRLHLDPVEGALQVSYTCLANVARRSHHHAVLQRKVDGVAAARVVEERKADPQTQMALFSSQVSFRVQWSST